MANWHTLTGDDDGNSVRVVFHVAIPGAGNNRAGIQWRVALINSGVGGTTILADGNGSGGTISAAEKASIQSGAIYETIKHIHTNPGETNGQLVARLNTLFIEVTNSEQSRLQKLLTYYGGVTP